MTIDKFDIDVSITLVIDYDWSEGEQKFKLFLAFEIWDIILR